MERKNELEKNAYIETHENITLVYETANLGTRFAANFIDTLIRGVIYVILILLFILSWGFGGGVVALLTDFDDLLTSIAVVILVIFIINLLYSLLFEILMNGRTPGKCCMGIRVISATGEPPTASMLLLRNIMRFFHAIPGGKLADGLVILFNSRSQRIGDLLAKTMVIKVRKDKQYKATLQSILETAGPEEEAALYTEVSDPESEAIRKASDAEFAEGAFLSRGEYRELCIYLRMRATLTNRPDYDREMAGLIARRSGVRLPSPVLSEMQAAMLLTQAAEYLQRFYPETVNTMEGRPSHG